MKKIWLANDLFNSTIEPRGSIFHGGFQLLFFSLEKKKLPNMQAISAWIIVSFFKIFFAVLIKLVVYIECTL